MRIISLQIVFFMCFYPCMGCKEKNHDFLSTKSIDSLRVTNPWVQNIINNFYPLDTGVVLAENSYLFSENSKWDTSFTLILKREPTKVLGVYYEIVPGDDLSLSYGRKSFSFGGFSFETDTSTWNVIIDRSRILMNASYNEESRCMDCSSFTIAYNFQTNFSDPQSTDKFNIHADFLRDLLITPMKRLKKKD